MNGTTNLLFSERVAVSWNTNAIKRVRSVAKLVHSCPHNISQTPLTTQIIEQSIIHKHFNNSSSTQSTMISVAFTSLRMAAASPASRMSSRQLSMACASSLDKLNNILEEYRKTKWVLLYYYNTRINTQWNSQMISQLFCTYHLMQLFARVTQAIPERYR